MIKKNLLLMLIILLAAVLRFYSLDKNPAGLNADEAAIGYNAWSLIQTGKDEHGQSWPLVFRSFDDYKPAVYFYLVLPFVKVLGLSVLSVRLPSAILGTISVYLLYLIVLEIFKKDTTSKQLAMISSFLLAISPWHLQFSRGGWEVNASLFFLVSGILFFLKGLKSVRYFCLFSLSMAISMYTYHSMRIIAPLISLSLVVIYFKEILSLATDKKSLKTILVAILLGVLVSVPLIMQMISKEGQSRFSGVSVFSDEGPLWQALELRREHNQSNIYVRAIHNKYISYGLRFVENYLAHFSPRFLFVVGDEIARSKVPGMGQFQLFLFPLYFLGLFNLLKLDSPGKKLFFFWLIVAPVAAALTFQSPHALRSQNMTIPLVVLFGLGLNSLLEKSGTIIRNSLICLFLLISTYFTGFYLHQYYTVYPKQLPYAWQYGFDQIGDYILENQYHYDKIIITDRYDQPYILMAFFLKYPPEKLQKEIVLTKRDKFGFSTVKQFGIFEFRSINYEQDKKIPNALIVSSEEGVDDRFVIHTIEDPSGKTMYKFISTNLIKNEK